MFYIYRLITMYRFQQTVNIRHIHILCDFLDPHFGSTWWTGTSLLVQLCPPL